MAALLRHGVVARRLGAGSIVQRAVAEEQRRLASRFMHTKERIAEGKKTVKHLPDQVSPTPGGGFDWPQFPYADVRKAVASICNGVIKDNSVSHGGL